MASIRTAIELQDNFTSVFYGIIRSVNLGMSAMEDMQRAMNNPVDTASLEGARNEINRATIAVRDLSTAMRSVEPLDMGDTHAISIPVKPVPAQIIDVIEPVRVPVEWQTDGLQVFMGSGMERFDQEVQSTNLMLEQLNDTQTAIALQAENTDIFPADMPEDLNQIADRIDYVRTCITAMEQNPVNIGADRANMELERMRGQLRQAISAQTSLNQAIDRMDVSAANDAYLQLSGTISNTERNIRDNIDAQGQFNDSIQQGMQHSDGLMKSIKGMVAAYISMQSVKAVIGLSDDLAMASAKLDMMNDGVRTTEQLQNLIFASAERSRGSYLDTINTVAKLGNLVGDAFGSTEEVVAFSEQLNKQFILAGASTNEIKNATQQLTQALASGVLRGDELNSIFEQAPTIIGSISTYLDVPIGQIRELASEGLITADIVKNALFATASETDAKFAQMPKTFEQIGQSIQNTAIMAFDPVLDRLNEIANSDAFDNFVDSICQSLAFLAGVATEVFNVVAAIGGFIGEIWAFLGPLIMGVAAALAVYHGWQMAANAVGVISKGINIAMAAAQMMYAAATGTLTAAKAADIAAQWGLNAALYACPIMWIIMGIIILIAIIMALIGIIGKLTGATDTAGEAICGVFAVIGSFIGNVFIAAINLVIDCFIRLWNYIALFANFFANVFTDPIGAVVRLFFGFVDGALGALQSLASVIDTLFGTSFAESVAGWRTSLDTWVTDKYGTGEVIMEQKNSQDYHLDRLNYGDAWESGKNFAGGLSSDIPGYDTFDYSSYLTDISGNTVDIKDGMDSSEENLRYLRDIAEQETVNRFTTAEIKIEQTNHNSISSSMDLDGVVTGLTDAMDEAVNMTAKGVHT